MSYETGSYLLALGLFALALLIRFIQGRYLGEDKSCRRQGLYHIHASSAVVFPTKEPPDGHLAVLWNRRAADTSQIAQAIDAARAADTERITGLLAHINRLEDLLEAEQAKRAADTSQIEELRHTIAAIGVPVRVPQGD